VTAVYSRRVLGPRLRRLVFPVGIAAAVLLLVGVVAVVRHEDDRVVTGPDGASLSSANPNGVAVGASSDAASSLTSDAPSTSSDGTATTSVNDGGGGGGGAGSQPGRTTTTQGSGTTVPSTGSGVVGYAGCSQTIGAVKGYKTDGGTRMWPIVEFGGGTVQTWASQIAAPGAPLKGYWAVFEGAQQQQPASEIWWQLCTHPPNEEDDAGNSAAASRVRAELLRLSPPGTKIYVSAQNAYVAPHVCGITGPDGPSRMQALANQLVAQGLAQAGPNVGALHSVDQTPSVPSGDETVDDGCHPNESGQRNVLGPPMRDFFG
jgi:hypothetical protein